MDAPQLKQAIRDESIVIQHGEFLRCAMQNCDAELLDLVLNLSPSVISSLEVGDELVYLKEPALIEKLLSLGLNPTRPNWRGKTLLETCTENGNELLPNIFRRANPRLDTAGENAPQNDR